MKFIITGSGGCTSIPKPLCKCDICNEAREKGYPYTRRGCSLFLEDINLLIDTPEDIGHTLDKHNINELDYLFFSHFDSSNTTGIDIIENLNLNLLDLSVNKKCSTPINVLGLPNVLNGINTLTTKNGPVLDYYESLNIAKRKPVARRTVIDDIKISLIPANEEGTSTVFVFESNDKKLIYAPCDIKPFPTSKLFNDADYLVIGNTLVGSVLKDNFYVDKTNPLNSKLFSMEEALKIKADYNIDNLVFTHLEEHWGKSFDDYKDLEKKCISVEFAYDGMTIEL